jgi:hypothetical protein
MQQIDLKNKTIFVTEVAGLMMIGTKAHSL